MVEIRRTYKGETSTRSSPRRRRGSTSLWAIDLVNGRLATLSPGFSDHFKSQFYQALTQFIDAARGAGASTYLVEKMPEFKGQLPQFAHPNIRSTDRTIPPDKSKRHPRPDR